MPVHVVVDPKGDRLFVAIKLDDFILEVDKLQDIKGAAAAVSQDSISSSNSSSSSKNKSAAPSGSTVDEYRSTLIHESSRVVCMFSWHAA